jgi:hypothetical protein
MWEIVHVMSIFWGFILGVRNLASCKKVEKCLIWDWPGSMQIFCVCEDQSHNVVGTCMLLNPSGTLLIIILSLGYQISSHRFPPFYNSEIKHSCTTEVGNGYDNQLMSSTTVIFFFSSICSRRASEHFKLVICINLHYLQIKRWRNRSCARGRVL